MKKLAIALMTLVTATTALAQTAASQASESQATTICVVSIAVQSSPIAAGRDLNDNENDILLRAVTDASTPIHKALVSYCQANQNRIP